MSSYSYSKIKRWTECPLSFKLTYIDRVGQDSTDEMEVGAGAHRFFELWHNALRANQTSNKMMPKVADLAAQAWTEEPHPTGLFEDFLEVCRDFAEGYRPEPLPAGAQSMAELELSFDEALKPCLWDSSDCFIRAKIDRVDLQGNHAKITDYKTGYAGNADKFQVELYCFLLKVKFPQIERFTVEIYYVRSGFKQTWDIHADNLGPVEFQLRAQVLAISKDKSFKAKPGSRCQSCSVAAFCNKKASKLRMIAKAKDAETIAADVAVMEAQLKAKKDALKEWVREHGEITVNGLMFGFFPSEKYVVNVGEFIAACRQVGIDPLDALRADTTKIKKLCRENAQAADALAPAITVETNLRFDSKLDKQEKQKKAA